MNIKKSLATAFRQLRKAKNITQEDFSEVSSRTYVSTIERGLYSPTVEKIDSLAKTLKVHPLTLLTLAYLISDSSKDFEALCNQVREELNAIS
jgi:transcriptional regulator with XRE-family HTH domain